MTADFTSFTSLCYAFLKGETPPRDAVTLQFGCARSHVFGEPVLDPAKVQWGDDSPCSELVVEALRRGKTTDEVRALVKDVQDFVRFAEQGGLVIYRKETK